jgi:DNA-binding SARP family transcriptional activator
VSSQGVLQTVLSGGVQVFDTGVALKLSKQTQRVIVGLASSRGAPVHADTLVDRLWDEPPADYHVATRVAVKRARLQLNDAPLLETVQLGYRYECDPATVDLWRFEFEAERLLVEPALASLAEIEACLAIWQGEPFGAFGTLPYLLPLTSHYSELHRSLQELWLTQLVYSDDPARAVRTGETLVAEEPLRENRWASLMVALYRNDRQTDALRAYQRARDALADAAGLEPGSVLVDLERRILDHDPSLLERLSSSGANRMLSSLTLVGRGAALPFLTEPGGPGKVCVVGEPGIGKTSLLRAAGQLLESQAKHVVFVSTVVTIDTTERPNRPAEALATLITQVLAIPAVTAPTAFEAAALASLVPQHQFVGTDLGSEPLERSEVLIRVSAYLGSVIKSHDIAVIVDDCQWLDRVSAEVLRSLVLQPDAVLLFASNPSTQPHLEWLFANEHVKTLELEAFELDDVRSFLEMRRVPSTIAMRAEEFLERSGGNPLLLDLLVDAVATNHSNDLSASTRAVVLRRLEALSQRAIATLEYASVLGKYFSVDTLSAARPGALSDLVEASDARLLAAVRSETGDRHFLRDEQLPEGAICAFQHGLVAEIVYSQIPEGRKVELHDQIGEILFAQQESSVAVARHFLAAAALDPLRAARSSFRAALEHEAAYAFEEALGDCDRGLFVLDQYNRSALQLEAELQVKSGRMLRLCQLPNSRARLLRGAELARSCGADELFATAVIELCSHGETTKFGSVDSEVVAMLDDALNLALPLGISARLCASAATLLSTSSAGSRGREQFIRAMQLAETTGQPELEADVLMNTQLGLPDPDDVALRAVAAERLFVLAHRNGTEHRDTLHLWESRYLDFNVSMVKANKPAMDQAVNDLRELTPLVRERPRTFGMAIVEGAYAHASGDLTVATEHAESMLKIGLAAFDSSWVIALYSALKLSIEIDRGSALQLSSTVDRLLADQPESRTWQAIAALMALEGGNLKRAGAELHHVVQNQGSLIARDYSWGPTVMCAARVAHGLKSHEAAQILRTLIAPYTGQMSWSGAATFGPFDFALSLLCSTLGDEASAEHHRLVSNSLARNLGCVSYER